MTIQFKTICLPYNQMCLSSSQWDIKKEICTILDAVFLKIGSTLYSLAAHYYMLVEMKFNFQKSSNFNNEKNTTCIKDLFRKLLLYRIYNINSVIHDLELYHTVKKLIENGP